MTELLNIPPPPPGFQIVPPQDVPPPPPGFQLVQPAPAGQAGPFTPERLERLRAEGIPQERLDQQRALDDTTEAQMGESSMLDTIMSDYVQPAADFGAEALRRVGYLSQEAARGVTQMAGAPVDLVNISPMALNLLPGVSGVKPFTDRPFGGSQMMWDGLTAPRDILAQDVLGLEGGDGKPKDMFDRVGGRIAQELGAAALPTAGFVSAGNRMGVQGARAMQESARPISRFTGRMVESAAVNPRVFAANELGYAAAAGTGAGLAREMAPEGWEDAADFAGALTGTGVMAGAQTLGRTVADVSTAVTGRGGSQLVRDEVAGQLGKAGGAPLAPSGAIDTSGLAQTLRTGRSISDVVPGFQATTADVAQNPGLAALEYGRSSGGPNTGLYAQRRTANQEAATDAINALRPDATPGAFSEVARGERDARIGAAQERTAAAQQELDTALTKLQAVQSGEARGQTVRSALEDAERAARSVEREAWAGVRGEADPADVAARVQAVTDGLPLARRDAVSDLAETLGIPSRLLPEDEVAAAATGAVRVPLEEITAMRSRLTTAQRQASAAGDADKANIIGQYVDAVDGYLGTLDIGEALNNARAVSRDLNDRFTRRGTPIADALATRPGGGPARPDSEVARSFVRPDEGQASNIGRLLTETESLPTAPQVRDAIQDQILADVKSQGLLERPDRLEKYLDQYGSVFERFPELKADLGTAAGLRRVADEAKTAQSALTRELGGVDGQPGASSVAKYLAFGDERAPDAMASVVAARDPAKAADELMRFVGDDPKAVEGARAALWGLMEKRTKSSGVSTKSPGGEQPFRFQQLDNFLKDPATRAVAERLYRDNPEHLENLSAISESLRSANFGQTGRAPNTSGTPQGLKGSEVLPSTETLGSRSFAYARGQVGLPFLALNIGSTMARRATLKGRGKEFQELLDKALLDPKLASALLEQSNPANIKALTRAAKVHLGVRTAFLDDLLTDAEEPSLEDQIME
jgi:hypothetical protein